MPSRSASRGFTGGKWLLLVALGPAMAGCQLPAFGPMSAAPLPSAGPTPIGHVEDIPRELSMVSLPAYRVAPPDVLLIDAIKVVPREPYDIEPLDILSVQITGDPEGDAVAASYLVSSGGSIDLGPRYGQFPVVGQTVQEAAERLLEFLSVTLDWANPGVSISLAEPAAKQRIEGEHLVAPDGTINLGTYGGVKVVGLTLAETRSAIEEHLSQYLESPQVGVDVFAYNSMAYYLVLQGAGQGDQLLRVPLTGGETVLDAISQNQGLTPFSSKQIWIARPAPDKLGYDQILQVDWDAIVQSGNTATNYQILPGDRVFVAENPHLALNTFVTQLLDPIERVLGFSLLGAQTIQVMNRFPRGFQQGQGGF